MRLTVIDGVPLYKQPWYGSYHSMIDRCYRETSQNYKFYGGRGIKVCEEWLNPIKFAEWVKNSGYQPGLWIDRRDTEGDYTPENCKWSTPKEQANNRRNNVPLTYKGETHNLAEWAEILGVKKSLIKNRRWRGWSIERIIEQEVEKHEK